VSTIAEWLVSLGMAEYTQRFAENGIAPLVGREEECSSAAGDVPRRATDRWS
jgi:hypothetical protein